jgi:SAM-dependent methyltransferase
MSVRKESERDFHNRRFSRGAHDIREPLGKWYGALAACWREQDKLIRQYAKGAKVLEYGCADGRISLLYDRSPIDASGFSGIDISDGAIDSARKLAIAEGFANCEFTVMDAERMTFFDNEFDLVFGRGILHHLDLKKACGEISRVLRPGGKAIFSEPLGHNPALNLFRKMTPQLRTPDEHPLVMDDVKFLKTQFSSLSCRYFGLTTPLAIPLQKTVIGSRSMRLFEELDNLLFRIPLIARNAWVTLLVMTK